MEHKRKIKAQVIFIGRNPPLDYCPSYKANRIKWGIFPHVNFFLLEKKIKISFSNTTRARDSPLNCYPNYKTNIVKKIQVFHINKHDFLKFLQEEIWVSSSYIKRIHSPYLKIYFIIECNVLLMQIEMLKQQHMTVKIEMLRQQHI